MQRVLIASAVILLSSSALPGQFCGAVPSASTSYPPPDDYCPLEECDCTIAYGILDCSDNQWRNLDRIIGAYALGDKQTHAVFSKIGIIGLQGNPIRSLPAYGLLLEFLPNLRAILVGDAETINCTQVDRYRRLDVQVQSEACPMEDDMAWNDKLQVATSNSIATTNAAPVLPAPSWMPVTITSSTIFPSNNDENMPLSSSTAHWTMFFLNCCFIGIVGMVVGACAALLLPFLFRTLYHLVRKGCQQESGKAATGRQFQPLLPQSSNDFIMAHPGSGKRIVPTNF